MGPMSSCLRFVVLDRNNGRKNLITLYSNLTDGVSVDVIADT